ncbi:MAG: Asp-tRNA(Asn)/Glu-tRNA(Gln) amidotransferase GatCAB subunit C [Candidatus Coatesbacteria bacterium]|nr:MAG: Asp-tRNA(Asn)/Glu-tRNA(Gln) amidotransferase GatCAB subunit C [Candidatus Coatesbacteria bacterium]
MQIGKEQVEYLARLSGIELDEAEKETFSRQLLRIIGYVEQIGDLDLSGVPPTAHTQDLTNVMREDECRPGLPQDAALAMAPDRQGDYFRVPKVIKSE